MSATTRWGVAGAAPAAELHELEEGDLVAIRRNLWLSGGVAGLSTLVGLGYLLRGSGPLDLVVGSALLLVAILNATALWSARTPVLVADEHGIRLRVGLAWRGLPWSGVRQVVVEHADNPLRESRLVVVPRDPASSLDDLDWLGRLHVRWNQLWYGAPLSVPLGITTQTDSTDLGHDLGVLADLRTDVVQLRGHRRAQLDDPVAPPVQEDPDGATAPHDAHDSGSHVAENPVEGTHSPETLPPLEDPSGAPVTATLPAPDPELSGEPAAEPVNPVRPLSQPTRVEIRLDTPAVGGRDGDPAAVASGTVPAQRGPEEAAVDRIGEETHEVQVPDLVHVEAWEELPVEVEAEDLSVRPPAPVIGPKIAHARQMLDMDIDELSERTRIRPHVLEAIEVDDFGPCGGDFYARGHLTAVARVVGLDVGSLITEFDERYAGGPINARRVFEAELATGLGGGLRATRGGPQWSVLIGAVLCLAMVWGVARLLSGDPAEVAAPPTSSGEAAGLAANHQPITSPLMRTTAMTVTAAHAGAHVVVRDRTGRILWSGDLRMTHSRKVVGLAPFKVESDNGGAIEVTVRGESRGTLGTAGEAASKRFD